ncbi:S-layer homology domain-containing protein [Marinicrinis lubricantis]|uniref:S-layer homology domain-containing protein n=1 Tax=Marinicrinis lubricantis TaxID=2086470 RepID=A0ABW1IJM6_9BACL
MPAAASEGQEWETQLLNPGFELELAGGDIPGWSVDPSTASFGTASINSDLVRTGSYSLLFEDKTAGTKPEGHFRILSHEISASEGDSVTFDVYVHKAAAEDQSHGLQPVIHYYNEAGTEILPNEFVNYGSTAIPVGEWFQISVTAEAPAGTSYVRVGLYSGFPSLTKVYVDDAKVTIVPDESVTPDPSLSTELINPGFEEALDEGHIPGWSIDPLTTGVMDVNTENYRSGAASLYFKDSSSETSLRVLSNEVAVTAGDAMVVEAHVYVIEQTHNIVTQMYYYNADNEQVGVDEALFSDVTLGSRKWSAMRVLSNVPENAVYARVALYSGAPSLTEAYFDDVSLTVLAPDIPLDRSYESPDALGDMVYVNLGQAGAVQTNAAGENEVYFVSNGKPGSFFVVDGETGALKFQEVIPNTIATWAMTIGPDQNVYFSGTEDGKLYRYLPLEKKIEYLGYNETDNWTWDLEAIGDKIYGGTFNSSTDGKLFEYDITNQTFRNYGVVEDGQQYVRGIAVDEDYIYAGLGTTLRLYKIDRVTGEKTEIHVPGYSGETGMVADIFVHGGKLFVSVSTVNMVVIDIETGEVDASFQYSNMISEPSPDQPDVIYYKYLTQFYKYDMSTKQSTEIILPFPLPDTTRVKDMAWIKLQQGEKAGQTVLAMVTQYGEYMLIDPDDASVSFIELDIDAQPVNIQSLKRGFDGRLYMGGYQRGMSVYNPFTDQLDVSISSFAQPEGIGFMNDRVYYGTYVSAVMYEYDPSLPAVLNENPKLVFDIEHQDRPFAITSGDNKLFVGTVPDYGYLGGALVIYDEASDTWKQYDHEEVVRNQSIIGLAYKDGLLYGSTTVWGGLGIEPSEPEAKLFVWDVERGQKIDEFTLDGLIIDEAPRMIGSISFGPDGLLWGVVDGTLFAMDVETKQIVKSKMISPSMYNSSKWLPYELEWAPDGTLYTTLSRKVIAIDPETMQHKVVVDEFVNSMTLGIDGSIYYAPNAGASLSRIAVPETDATLSKLTVDGQLLEGFSSGVLNYTASLSDMAVFEAVPTQPNAVVTIEDLRAAENKVIIHVTGTDGKSKLDYTVEIAEEPVDPEEPGEPEEPTEPGQPTVPYVPSPGNPAEDAVQKVRASDITVNEQGIVHIPLQEGIESIQLPPQVSELATGRSVVLASDQYTLEIPSATLVQLEQLVSQEEREDAHIVIHIAGTEESNARQLLQSAMDVHQSSIVPASELYGFTLSIVTPGGKEEMLAEHDTPAVLTFRISEEIDPEITALYQIGEDGILTYAGGVIQNGWISAKVAGEGTYAALEFNKSFEDVAPSHWSYQAIQNMAVRLIAHGVSGNSFAPNQEITRAEFVSFISRGLGLKASGNPTSFTDVDADESWYASDVSAAYEAGIVSGQGEGLFSPNHTLTREEMTLIVVRAYEYLNGSAWRASDAAAFTDQDRISAWAKESVQAAYEIGLVSGRGNQLFDPKGQLTRAEAMQVIYNLLTK